MQLDVDAKEVFRTLFPLNVPGNYLIVSCVRERPSCITPVGL